MWMISVGMSRSGNDLQDDIACVLIGGSKIRSDEGSDLYGGGRASGGEDSTLRTSDCDGVVKRGHQKERFTDRRS